jgi:hypothetical protein
MVEPCADKIYLRIFGIDGLVIDLETCMSTDKLKTMYDSEVVLTTDDNYTHVIIINTCMPELKIPKENVVSITYEPNVHLFVGGHYFIMQFFEYAKKHISKCFVEDIRGLPEQFMEGQTFCYYNTTHFYYKPKSKFCSIVISKRNSGLNYSYRHKLVEAILFTDLPIDIYGYGVDFYKDSNDERVKHALENTHEDPFGTDPFEDYKFHICIENVISNSYFSEKIINPLLSNNIPIYYGCKSIDNYFSDVIKLTGDVEEDIHILTHIYQNQGDYSNTNIYEGILEKTNLFINLHNLFDTIGLKPS